MFVGGALTLKGNIAHLDFTDYAVLCLVAALKKNQNLIFQGKKSFFKSIMCVLYAAHSREVTQESPHLTCWCLCASRAIAVYLVTGCLFFPALW